MDFVGGVPITEYCDTERLSSHERLELLFARVCEAVQHPHSNGIIHRDVKPSNVLVSLQDGKPVPKVIDFGVAKATNQRLTENTLFTELGVMIGTPEYMSPEQAGGQQLRTSMRGPTAQEERTRRTRDCGLVPRSYLVAGRSRQSACSKHCSSRAHRPEEERLV